MCLLQRLLDKMLMYNNCWTRCRTLGVTNDQGILLHPDVTPEEVMQIEQVMKVPPMVGAACFGSPYVGAGICASNNGALAGSETTGPEMNRIEDALGLI